MTTAAKPVEPVSIQVEFEDNRLLPAVFGEHGRNLARMEQRLDVSLNNRGNQVTISGPMEAVDAAREALDRLYESARSGHNVDQAEVDAAVRMAEGAGNDVEAGAEPFIQTRRKRIVARSPNQALYMRTIDEHEMVFATGPAGTGKTYLAVCAAVAMLTAGRVDRIVLSRPAVEAGERLGFLPGDMRDKVDPYLQPLYDALYDAAAGRTGGEAAGDRRNRDRAAGLHARADAVQRFVILDEAQNTTPVQMKMALTRIGESSRMVITGDLTRWICRAASGRGWQTRWKRWSA